LFEVIKISFFAIRTLFDLKQEKTECHKLVSARSISAKMAVKAYACTNRRRTLDRGRGNPCRVMYLGAFEQKS